MDGEKNLRDALEQGWQGLRDTVLPPKGETIDEKVAELASEFAPVIWLIGKVQSGKTSIVRALTDASAAEVGQGYKPCTKTASLFDFPSEAPIIRFLDTRGLGEKGYDPSKDIGVYETQSHLMIAVMKAMDPQQDAVVEAVKAARKRHREWPLIVAQTTLHEGYAHAQNHPPVYPYGEPGAALPLERAIPPDLERSLAYQRSLFEGLPGNGLCLFVPIDFTQEGDGYEPREFGYDAFLKALGMAAPAGLVAALRDASAKSGDTLARAAHPHIMGYASAAAAVDAMPVAGAVGVPVVQSKMLHSLGRIYGVAWNRKTLSQFVACLGAGAVSRYALSFGFRQLAKLIPVYGQTAGAAAAAATSFATTFAMGKAACYFLAARRMGRTDPQGVAKVYGEALAQAFRFKKPSQGHAS